ncbi:hypothetical protein A3715_20100, partial [Oleiphilus sp. HI0009]
KLPLLLLTSSLIACGGGGGGGGSTGTTLSDTEVVEPEDQNDDEVSYTYEEPQFSVQDVTEDTLFQNANGVTHALTHLLYEYNTFNTVSVVPPQYNPTLTPTATATEACDIDGAYTAEVYAPSKTEQSYNRVLYSNEYMNIRFNKCASIMTRATQYLDGQINTRVLRGAYNSNDVIVNPTEFVEEYVALANFDPLILHSYENGTVEHFVTDTTHQITMDDFVTHDSYRQYGYSTFHFKNAELTVTEIPASNIYSSSYQLTNTDPFSLSVRTSNNIHTVDIIEPVIIDRFTGDAIFDGLVEVVSGNSKIQIDYQYTYADVSLDSDGDGSYDTFITIDNIFYD